MGSTLDTHKRYQIQSTLPDWELHQNAYKHDEIKWECAKQQKFPVERMNQQHSTAQGQTGKLPQGKGNPYRQNYSAKSTLKRIADSSITCASQMGNKIGQQVKNQSGPKILGSSTGSQPQGPYGLLIPLGDRWPEAFNWALAKNPSGEFDLVFPLGYCVQPLSNCLVRKHSHFKSGFSQTFPPLEHRRNIQDNPVLN